MIANEIAAGKSFKENILYNVRGKKNDPNPEKCAWFEVRNLITDDMDAAGKIMEATASKSRAKKPVFHFSLDWHPDEANDLTQERALEAADQVVAKMGLSGHQAIYFWHTDSDHPHMHIVVNRVHEEKTQAWDLWKSKERLERNVAEVAREMGFLEVAGRHNDLEFEPDREKGAPTSKEQRAVDNELTPWVKEDVKLVKDTIQHEFYDATSWKDLTGRLDKYHLRLQSKGQGLIITDGEKFMKLSEAGKGIRLQGKNSLEERFNESWKDYANDLTRDVEQKLEEKSKQRVERANKNVDRNIASVDEQLAQLMDTVEELQEFDAAGNVQKSADQLLRIKGKVRRQEFLLGRAEELLEYHEGQFNQLLTKIYKSPDEAKQNIAELTRTGQLKDTIAGGKAKQARWKHILDFLKRKKKKQIGKKRGVKVDRFKSKARKEADLQEGRVFYRLQKIREAQNRIRSRKDELASVKEQSVRQEKELEQKRETEKALIKRRDKAVSKVSARTIIHSNIGWPMKRALVSLRDEYELKQGPGKSRQKDKEKDRDPFED